MAHLDPAETTDKSTWPTKTEWLQILWTVIKTFLTTFIAMILAFGKGVFDLTGGEFKGAAAAGIAAVLMVIINFLNPNDPRYGLGSKVIQGEVVNNDPANP